VGGRGEIVKVKAGYARNYLLPRGLATLATKGNVKQIEQERAALLKKAAVEKATAEAQREQMESIVLTFERKAGEQGTLFGSVTSMDIADALKEKGYEIDRKRVLLREPIKETGEYTVTVKLHREVTLPLAVVVTAEGGETPDAGEKKPKKGVKAGKAEAAQSDEAQDSQMADADAAGSADDVSPSDGSEE
jgi:large subunit ribosomal protein L9